MKKVYRVRVVKNDLGFTNWKFNKVRTIRNYLDDVITTHVENEITIWI